MLHAFEIQILDKSNIKLGKNIVMILHQRSKQINVTNIQNYFFVLTNINIVSSHGLFSGKTKNNRHFGYPETKITDFKFSVTRLGTTFYNCRFF